MGYIGNQQTEGFSQVPAKQDLTGAVGTSLTLTHAVASAEGIDLFINNVRQEPTEAYSVGGDGITVTLTGAVAATDDIYVVYNSLARQTSTHPSNQALQATSGTFSGTVTANAFSGNGSSLTGVGVAGISSSSTSGTAVSIDANNIVTMPYQPAVIIRGVPGNTCSANELIGRSSDGGTTVMTNIGNHFSTGTGDFTCPVSGVYAVTFTARRNGASAAGTGHFRVNNSASGTGKPFWEINNLENVIMHFGVSGLIYANANDTINFLMATGTIVFDANDQMTITLLG